jgi:hypothetical protein
MLAFPDALGLHEFEPDDLQLAGELAERCPKGLRPSEKFRDGDSPLTALDLRNEGLIVTEFLRERGLRESSTPAQLSGELGDATFNIVLGVGNRRTRAHAKIEYVLWACETFAP